MSNIAEGFESGTRPLLVRYLRNAKGSAGELRSQLYTALDVGYLTEEEFVELSDAAEKCSRQLSRFITYLKSHPSPRSVQDADIHYETEGVLPF